MIELTLSCDYCEGHEYHVKVEDPNDPSQMREALEKTYAMMQKWRDNCGQPRPPKGAPYWEIPHWTEMDDGTLCCYDCVRNGRHQRED